MNESIEDLEKLHAVAARAVSDLKKGIESRVGFKTGSMWMDEDGKTFCYPEDGADPCDNLSQSMADMVAEVSGFDPIMKDKARLREIDRERARLVAKLEASQ